MAERLNPRLERASMMLARMNPTHWVAPALQADWGKCGEAWMVSYCAQSCKRCACTSDSNTTSATLSSPSLAPPASPGASPGASPAGVTATTPAAPPPASAHSGPASQQQLLQPLLQQLGGTAPGGAAAQPAGSAGQPACQTDVLNFVR